MHVKNGILQASPCQRDVTLKSGQAFGVSRGRLVQHYLDGTEFHLRKIWVDNTEDKFKATVKFNLSKKILKDSSKLQSSIDSYVKAGFAPDPSGRFVSEDKKTCLAMSSKKQRPTSKQGNEGTNNQAKASNAIVKKMLKKPESQISKLSVKNCSSGSEFKWVPRAVSSTIWQVR